MHYIHGGTKEEKLKLVFFFNILYHTILSDNMTKMINTLLQGCMF